MPHRYTAGLFCFIILLCTLSCSCTETDVNADENERISKYGSEIGSAATHDYSDVGSWFSAEDQYTYSSSDSCGRIIRFYRKSYNIQNDRIYYPVKIYYEGSENNESSMAYISINTGERFSLCPDPFCTHLDGSGCKYLNLSDMLFAENSDDIFYAVKHNYEKAGPTIGICLIDPVKDTVKEIYTDDDIAFIFPRFITDGRLYFSTVQIDKTKNTDGTLTRETTEEHLSIDLTTYDVIRTENKYGSRQNGEYYYSDGQYIFFADPGTGRLFVTDMNFENEITLLEYTDEYMISDMYYDMDTSELYVCVCSKYMEGMQGAQLEDGKIYCIDKGLNCRQLNMPTDKILDFRLTDKYIYYTIYDPVVYGVSPRGTSCIEENGNKIYRTPRSNPSGGELIFDGRNELFFFDYFITGNYLYIDYMQFMDEGGMNWFRVMGVTARIDMKKDTIKWLNLN